MSGEVASVANCLGLVLVIDDQPVNIRLVKLLLQSAGYSVVAANSGEEGLALAALIAPDLVLLDLRMPGMDGFEVIRKIRADPRLFELPVIFLTADNDRDNLIRAFALGATDYVSKPFVTQELLSRVRTHVDLRQSREALGVLARQRLEAAHAVARELGEYFAEIRLAAHEQAGHSPLPPELASLADAIGRSADAGMDFVRSVDAQHRAHAEGCLIEALHVRQALQAAAELHSSGAKAKGVALDLLPHEAVVVAGLRSGTAHVLGNLLANAITHSVRDSRIALGVVLHGACARMQVMDRAPDIVGLDRERLFQRFAPAGAEDDGAPAGANPGLAFSRHQARAMGGDLWFDARPGGGNVFTLELPLATSAQALGPAHSGS